MKFYQDSSQTQDGQIRLLILFCLSLTRPTNDNINHSKDQGRMQD